LAHFFKETTFFIGQDSGPANADWLKNTMTQKNLFRITVKNLYILISFLVDDVTPTSASVKILVSKSSFMLHINIYQT
jgi:hypothetical protein